MRNPLKSFQEIERKALYQVYEEHGIDALISRYNTAIRDVYWFGVTIGALIAVLFCKVVF